MNEPATTHSLSEGSWVGPKQKSRFRVLRNEGPDGPLEIEFVDEPGNPGPPMHWHPFAEEQFTVLEGRLELVVDGETVLLEAGHSRTVPRRARHTFRNVDPDQPVRFRSVHTPGRGFEHFLGSLYDLDFDGKTNEVGQPGLLATMAILAAHADVALIAGPPRLAQKVLAFILGGFARLLGHPGTYRSVTRPKKDDRRS